MKRILTILLLSLAFSGCASQAAVQETTLPDVTIPAETTPPETIAIQTEAIALAPPPAPAVPVVLECEAPGIAEVRSDEAVIDYSNADQGYVMVRCDADTTARLKVRVKGPRTTYTYNLPYGQWDVFPLSDGDGSYRITLHRNTQGKQYATILSAALETVLTDEFAPFLRPNQYVSYENAPETQAMSETLCTGLEAPLEKVAAVYDYVVDNLSYDYEKAATVKSGYLPVLDTVLALQKGICFDYAALMTAMLRCQQIPCKLVVGYAGSTYHAWISVWTEENGWIDGAIFFDGQQWKRMDPTFASSSERDQKILDFIETGSYTVKYLY